MKPVSRRVQSEPTTLLYAAVVGWASWLPYMRSQYELAHAADVDAPGGMYAFGDVTLHLLVALVFMIPTAFLLWFVARFETFYTAYSWLLLVVSLTAPAVLALSGFHYSAVDGSFAVTSAPGRYFWSNGSGWGGAVVRRRPGGGMRRLRRSSGRIL